ncbi:MAG: hypothetical protein PUP93_29215 [Rhizonema sp. NSF051]|nr:hypothetical protein [Rhizonema sp. NSF051]
MKLDERTNSIAITEQVKSKMSLNIELLEQSFERLKADADKFTASFYR